MDGRAAVVGVAATAVAQAAAIPLAAEVVDQEVVAEGTVVEVAEAAIVRCCVGRIRGILFKQAQEASNCDTGANVWTKRKPQ